MTSTRIIIHITNNDLVFIHNYICIKPYQALLNKVLKAVFEQNCTDLNHNCISLSKFSFISVMFYTFITDLSCFLHDIALCLYKKKKQLEPESLD